MAERLTGEERRDVNRATLAKVEKLLISARELGHEQSAIFDEIDELLGGGVTISAKMKAFEQAFDRAWCARYAPGETGRYVWNYRQDKPQVKRLVKMLALDDLDGRAARYLASDDPFYSRHRHPFGTFVSQVNRFAAPASAPAAAGDAQDDTGAIGCRHDPRCRSDQEHTKKRSAELRA